MDMSEEEFENIDAFVLQKSFLVPAITAQNLSSIYQCPDQQMYRARIQFLFALDRYIRDDSSREALIDMVHNAILFACDNDFSYPKAIVFLTMYMEVFQGILYRGYYMPDDVFNSYKDALLRHSYDRPPRANLIFDVADVTLIHDFFVNHVFRQMKLILYVFGDKTIYILRAVPPVHIPDFRLPPLSQMEIFRPDEEKPEPPVKGRSPRSPRQAAAERTPAKAKPEPVQKPKPEPPQKTKPEPQPEPEPEPEQPEEPEDRGPEVPLDLLRGTLQNMHETFVKSFEDREKQIVGKIKEMEIRMHEKPPPRKTPPTRRR